LDLGVFEESQNLAEEGQWMEVETPGGEGTDIHLKLAGSDSSYYQKQIQTQQRKMLKKKKFNKTPEEIENDNIELLAACTLDWQNVAYKEESLDCTKYNVRWLYKAFQLIREQIDEFIGDRSNFLPS